MRAAERRNYRKEQQRFSKEGIAADIRVPYTSGGESALGAASAARQLVAAMLETPEQSPTSGSGWIWHGAAAGNAARAMKAIYDCVARGQPAQRDDPFAHAGGKSLQPDDAGPGAANADTRLTSQDIDMYLDRLQTAKPIVSRSSMTDDEVLESYFAALRQKEGRPPAGRIITPFHMLFLSNNMKTKRRTYLWQKRKIRSAT